MPSQFVNSFGLLLGAIGAFILFWKAYPQPSFDGSTAIGLEDNNIVEGTNLTALEYKQKVREEREQYKRVSQCGLALLMIGFAFQFVAIWLP
jgi:hypothetical protein